MDLRAFYILSGRMALNSLGLALVFAFGQSSTGSIAGTVNDPNDTSVSGANVALMNAKTGNELATTTNGHGAFNVASLVPGTYTVTINATGFKQTVVTESEVEVGDPSSIDVELEVGEAGETVTVTDDGELFKTQTADRCHCVM